MGKGILLWLLGVPIPVVMALRRMFSHSVGDRRTAREAPPKSGASLHFRVLATQALRATH